MTVSKGIKDSMIVIAKERHGKISPCGVKTLDQCFTIEGDLIIFWFNDKFGSTRVITKNL